MPGRNKKISENRVNLPNEDQQRQKINKFHFLKPTSQNSGDGN